MKEILSKEEDKVKKLLQPRYEVIALWPKSNRKVQIGDILKYDDEFKVFWCKGDVFNSQELEEFPHLFRKLSWWEKREESEMPGYLKEDKQEGYVCKVKKHFSDSKGEHNNNGCQLEINTDWNYFTYRIWLPATETDYLTFINKKKVCD